MKEPYFKNAQVGDRVVSYTYGEGRIDRICNEVDSRQQHPLLAVFEKGGVSLFTYDGVLGWASKIGGRQDLYYEGTTFDVNPAPEPERWEEREIEVWVNIYNLQERQRVVNGYVYATQLKADEHAASDRLGEAAHVVHKYKVKKENDNG